jgi:hypothetical protein
VEFGFEYGGDPQDVTISASGVADLAGLRRLSADFKSDPRYRAGLVILADYSDLDMSGLSDLDIEQVAAATVQHQSDSSPGALAIVASNLQTFVRAREGIAHLGGSQAYRRAFKSHEEAMAWLREQR